MQPGPTTTPPSGLASTRERSVVSSTGHRRDCRVDPPIAHRQGAVSQPIAAVPPHWGWSQPAAPCARSPYSPASPREPLGPDLGRRSETRLVSRPPPRQSWTRCGRRQLPRCPVLASCAASDSGSALLRASRRLNLKPAALLSHERRQYGDEFLCCDANCGLLSDRRSLSQNCRQGVLELPHRTSNKQKKRKTRQ